MGKSAAPLVATPMTDPIEVQFDPPDLPKRFAKAGGDLEKELLSTMGQAMFHLQDSAPSYPPKPAKSKYRRTGTLGRSLTLGGDGNYAKISKIGNRGAEAKFGTRIKYAVWVIGDPPGKSQAKHMGHWWTMNTVKEEAEPGIKKLFAQMARRMADFIAGKGA